MIQVTVRKYMLSTNEAMEKEFLILSAAYKKEVNRGKPPVHFCSAPQHPLVMGEYSSRTA